MPADQETSRFPVGDGLILRRSQGSQPGLRAWDAADEQLVEEALSRIAPGQRVAVVDDSHGALALGLATLAPTVVADNAGLADRVTANAGANGLDAPTTLSWQHELQGIAPGRLPEIPPDRFDAVIAKVPRHLDYLEFLLRWCNRVLRPGGLLLTGGMIKHLPDQATRVYGRLVTTETVLPARKKARLVVCRPGDDTLDGWPGLWRGYQPEGMTAFLQALPAVFARDHLDIGTRELLPQVPAFLEACPEQGRVLDLGCGNGVLGLSALACRQDLSVTFSDVSAQAVLSAQANLMAAGIPADSSQFCHADGIARQSGRFERILLNPPFHEGGVVGDHIAIRLFAEAAGHLATGGALLMVGNRHLGYHRSLRSVFSDVQQLHATPKFVVFRAAAPR